MNRVLLVLIVLLVPAPGASAARACPYCESDIGREVAAGIFDGEFALNVVKTLLPFPVLLGLVAVVHFGVWPAGGGAVLTDAERSGKDTPSGEEQP
jgi:hypothetical protein